MINDEDQATKYFRYLDKLKRNKEEAKCEELKLKMNLRNVKDFVTSNIEQ